MRSVSLRLKTFYNWTCINPGCSQFTITASLVAQLVKNPPAMQETPVQLLGWEDPLEKRYTPHSSILGLPLWLSW